jgi:hypothetical protein
MARKLEFSDLSQLRSLYWQGWPTRRIARALHVDRSVIQRILTERGLPTYTHAGANTFRQRADGGRAQGVHRGRSRCATASHFRNRKMSCRMTVSHPTNRRDPGRPSPPCAFPDGPKPATGMADRWQAPTRKKGNACQRGS